MAIDLTWYETQWEKYATQKFDHQFDDINGMTWLPWVGNNYDCSRILIVAESHYVRSDNDTSAENAKTQWNCDKFSTREVVAEYPLYGYRAGWVRKGARGTERNDNPTFDNLTRLLTGSALLNDAEQPLRGRLWSKLAYMNLIQRLMWLDQTEGSERPTDEDRAIGWDCVTKVLDILNPRVCLVAGIEAARYFNATMQSLGRQSTPLISHSRIGRCSPRSSKLLLQTGEETDVIFIKHPGRYFSWKKWHEFIISNHASLFRPIEVNKNVS